MNRLSLRPLCHLIAVSTSFVSLQAAEASKPKPAPDSALADAKLPPEGVRHASPEVYEKTFRQLVTRLRATGAKLICATTTPVPMGGNLAPNRRFDSVDKYNAIAARVMAEMGVATNDLNAAIAPHVTRVGRPNDVHFTPEGSALLAGEVARAILLQFPSR